MLHLDIIARKLGNLKFVVADGSTSFIRSCMEITIVTYRVTNNRA